MHTIGGNPHGSDTAFFYCSGSARGVATGGIASGGYCRKLETDMDINFGNSGGAIFNDQGQVVAVCEGIQTDADGVNMCIDVLAVHEYLDGILSLLPADTAEKLHQFGKRHHREGRYDIAIKCYSHAIRMDQTISQVYSDRALSYYVTDELTQAIADANQAINLDAKNADAYENRGLIHKDMGNLEDAIDDLQTAIQLNANNPWTSHYLAGIYYDQGDYAACVEAEGKAIEIDNEIADFHQRRADAYQELGQHQDALNELEAAVGLDNSNPYTFFLIGYSYFHLGKFEVSIKAFARGADLEPGDPASYWTWMADSARMMNKPEMAVEAYTRAIQLDSNSPFAFWGRGLVFQQAGLTEKADADFAQAESLLPGITDLTPRGLQLVKPSTNDSLMPGDLVDDRPAGNSQATLVGGWEAELSYQGAPTLWRVEFDGQGNYSSVFIVRRGVGSSESVEERGTYEFDGRKLTTIGRDGSSTTQTCVIEGNVARVYIPELETELVFTRIR